MYSSKRKVRSNGRTVVGQFSSAKKQSVQFESALEEGLIYILNFDSDVVTLHDQPVQIEYQDVQGKNKIYTPDYLVEYTTRSPVLFEVKPSGLIKKNFDNHHEKIQAATNFAKSNSWDFRVITEKEIHTEYCQNVRFLFRYQTYEIDLPVSNEILNVLGKLKKSTPNKLLDKMTSDPEQRLVYLASIWTLIFHKRICCNLFKKIHMDTTIWVNSGSEFKELKFPYKS
jgi:hypothetical protein